MNFRFNHSPIWYSKACSAVLLTALTVLLVLPASAAGPIDEPVVARVEMKFTEGEKVIDVIQQGDLLTVIEEREQDYVIVTHDGHQGAIDKVNAVRIAESGEVYTDLIQRHPNEGRFYTLRAASWWALGKADKALEDFDRAIELGYKEAHAFISRGLFHASMGSYEKAIADYEQALATDPDDIAPLVNRAAVYMMTAEYAKAVKDYTAALEKKPERTTLLHQRAIAYKAAGKLDQAIEDFTNIIKANEKDLTAVMGRGYVHFQMQDHRAAINDFAKAIELNPENAVAFNNRGYNRFQLGEFDKALEDYSRAIELAPNYPLALQNRAWLLATAENQDVRDTAAAVESAKQACELTNYESPADLSALAAALAADGKFDEAVGWQEKVVAMVGGPYKEFATKILDRYQNERPFAADPDAANAEEQARAESEAAEKSSAASKQAESDPDPKA